MKLTLSRIAEKTGGILYGDDMVVYSLETDSRRVTGGTIFAALRGQRADGFDFIPALDDIAGIAYLTDRRPDGCRNPCVVVDDVLRAIGDIAALHLSGLSAKRVAVTGSVGKTTTKNFIAAALGKCMKVNCSKGNRNNELGLPLSALDTDESDGAVVLEMGMRGTGQIRYLCSIARPDVSVITNIGVSHIELLGSRENILKAKSEIIEALPRDGAAVINGDDDMLKTLETDRKTLRFGIENKSCDILARQIVDNHFILSCNGRDYPVTLSVMGRHNIYNALAAFAAGYALGCDEKLLIEGIESFSGDGRRQNIYEFNGLRIFDDCYNASPDSMRAAFNVMSGYEGDRLLVLGDMLELGEKSEMYHRALAPDIKRLEPRAVICIGKSMRYLKDELGEVAFGCEDNAQALELIKKIARRGDNILFKGSLSMNLSELVTAFLGEWKK